MNHLSIFKPNFDHFMQLHIRIFCDGDGVSAQVRVWQVVTYGNLQTITCVVLKVNLTPALNSIMVII